MLKVLENLACKHPEKKDYIEENLKEVREEEGLRVEKVISFTVWSCLMSLSCLTALSFWPNKWSPFSCISYSVLEDEQMRYLNIYD